MQQQIPMRMGLTILFVRLFIDRVIKTPSSRLCSPSPLQYQGSLLSSSRGRSIYSGRRIVLTQWHLPAVKLLARAAGHANSPRAVRHQHGALAQLETKSD